VLKFKLANKGDLKNFIVNNIDSLLSDPSLPIKIFLDCLMNLTTIRKENIIHRDLKPENVLIHEEKNG
jgi:serine/threonine protein kinase